VSYESNEVSKVENGTKFGIDVGWIYYKDADGSWHQIFIEEIEAGSTGKRLHHSATHDFNFVKGTASTVSTQVGDSAVSDAYGTVQARYDGDHTITFTCTSVNGTDGLKLDLEYLWLTTNVRRPCVSVGSNTYSPYSIAVGEGLYAKSYEAVFGKYNVDFHGEPYALQIGGGTDVENPRDLFRVGVDGDIQFSISDYATSGTEDNTLYNLIVSMGWGNPAYGNTVILDDDGVVV
jgi:hypothetical protein